jgi:aspartyl-tRNA(Asn)/glutamyl-tRNA(Gln) amidotransferase subunit C
LFAKLRLVSQTNTSLPVPIQHIAKLAHLQNLTPEQLQQYEANITSIMNHMQEVTQLDLSTVPETSRVIEEENILRDDMVKSSFTQSQALQNAKHTHEGFFKVPAVLEERDA